MGVSVAATPGVICTPATTALGSRNASGDPSTTNNPDSIGAVCTMLLLKRKFCVKPRLSSTLKGNALLQRFRPESCQPPMIASNTAPCASCECLALPKRQLIDPVGGDHM